MSDVKCRDDVGERIDAIYSGYTVQLYTEDVQRLGVWVRAISDSI